MQTVVKRPTFIEFIIATSYTPVKPPALQTPQNSSTSEPQTMQTLTNTIDKRLDFFSTMTKEMAISRYFFSKSFFVKKHLRSEQLKAVQDVVNEIPNNTNGIQINSEQGAVGARQANDMAYIHRDSLFSVRLFFETMTVDGVVEGKKWMDKFVKSAQFMDSGETYQNYPDIELKDYLTRFYGNNLKKLIQIKRKWDPYRYFNSIMSIPTTFSNRNLYGVNKVHCLE